MTAKTIPDTHGVWQKVREQNKRQDSPLARGPPRENKAPHQVASVDFVENRGEMLGGGGGQCLCEAGLRGAARENGSYVIRV